MNPSLLLLLALPSSSQTSKVNWIDDWCWDKAVYSLEVVATNKPSKKEKLATGILQIKLAVNADRSPSAAEWKETNVEQPIDEAFPIKVLGDKMPQVFVLSETTWGYCLSIYTVSFDGIRCQVGESFRDLGALRWKYKGGALEAIRFEDRYDPEGVKREKGSEPGIRWARVHNYSFNAKAQEWKSPKPVWKRWDVNNPKDEFPKPRWKTEEDCPFRFRTAQIKKSPNGKRRD